MVAQENTRMGRKGQSVKLIEVEGKIRRSYEAPAPLVRGPLNRFSFLRLKASLAGEIASDEAI